MRRGQRETFDRPDAVGEEAEGLLRRRDRVELAHRARGGVARVDEGALPRRALPLVELGRLGVELAYNSSSKVG